MRAQPMSLEVDLDLLHVLAVAHDDVLPRERMRAVLERELGRFLEAVNDHFAHEERVSGRGTRGAELAAQHIGLRKQVEALQADVGTLTPARCRKRMLELLDTLAEHERGESV